MSTPTTRTSRPKKRSAKIVKPPQAATAVHKRRLTRSRSVAVEPVGFETGSGNVFADIGAQNADVRLAKAELARIIRTTIRTRIDADDWTQAAAAKQLGIAAADMSNLLRGKLAGFSQERLEQFLNRLGFDVQIRVSARVGKTTPAATTVEHITA